MIKDKKNQSNSRNEMIIQNDVLIVHKRLKIDISKIEKIEFSKKYSFPISLKDINAHGLGYTLFYGEKVHTSLFRMLSPTSWQELFNDLLLINPHIQISPEIQAFIDKDLTLNHQSKWNFDFTKYDEFYDKQQFEKRRLEEQEKDLYNSHKLKTYLGLVSLFLFLISCVISFLGYEYFGEEYILSNVLLTIGCFFLSISIMSILYALISQYGGHKLTIISAILGVICTILAFVL